MLRALSMRLGLLLVSSRKLNLGLLLVSKATSRLPPATPQDVKPQLLSHLNASSFPCVIVPISHIALSLVLPCLVSSSRKLYLVRCPQRLET
jgi:hypothetical protein